MADLGFTFTYPNFVLQRVTPEVLHKLQQNSPPRKQSTPDCHSQPMWALGRGGSAQHDELKLQRSDQNCSGYSTSLRQLRGETQGAAGATLIDMGLRLHTSQAMAFQLNGTDAYFAFASTTSGVTASYAAAVCTILHNNVLCWRAFSVTDSHLRALLGGTITFSGQQPQSLVPPELLALLPPDAPLPPPKTTERLERSAEDPSAR